MNFNKCNRCGNFYLFDGDVCPKCQNQDNLEYKTFKTYIEDNGVSNLENISFNTNISSKHIDRYMKYYSNYQENMSSSNIDQLNPIDTHIGKNLKSKSKLGAK